MFVRIYISVKELLESEGIKNVLSSGGNIEQGITSIHSLKNGAYEERIKKFGVYAIGIKLIQI